MPSRPMCSPRHRGCLPPRNRGGLSIQARMDEPFVASTPQLAVTVTVTVTCESAPVPPSSVFPASPLSRRFGLSSFCPLSLLARRVFFASALCFLHISCLPSSNASSRAVCMMSWCSSDVVCAPSDATSGSAVTFWKHDDPFGPLAQRAPENPVPRHHGSSCLPGTFRRRRLRRLRIFYSTASRTIWLLQGVFLGSILLSLSRR